MKRILVVSLTMPPDGSATAGIIANLLPCLQAKGWQVDGLTFKNSLYDSSIFLWKNITIHCANYVYEYGLPKYGIRDWLLAIHKKVYYQLSKGTTPIYQNIRVKSIIKTLAEIHAEKYDIVMAVCAYYDAAEAILRYKKNNSGKAKYVLYQVDPLEGNQAYSKVPEEELCAYEKKLYYDMDCVITTPLIYRVKKEAGWNMSHNIAVEFPGIHRLNSYELVQRKQENEIRCVYSGYLYPGIRDPEYTLQLFSKMSNKNIHLYILGSGKEELLHSYANGLLKGRLHIIGQQTQNVCSSWLESADVLVNIGNSVLNQVPSKIFNYIGYGKTIMNICKSVECPTIPYMKRYPLALNLIETDELTDEEASVIEQRLLRQVDKRMSFDQVKQIMKECTPEYVAEKMIDTFDML